jgi:hypothetical protein
MNTMTSVADRDSILKKYGYTVDEIRDIFVFEELDDNQYDILWDRGKPEELDSEGAVDKQMQDNINFNEGEEEIVSEWKPDYSKTAEYELSNKGIDLSMPKDGKFAELTDEQMDNIQNFIPVARVGKVVQAGKSMFNDAMNKLFASSKLKANQIANRGSAGEVVKGASRKLKDSNLRPSITNKAADKYSKMANKVKADNATKVVAGTTAATILGTGINNAIQSRNLQGNRDADGNLISRLGKHNIKVDLDKIAREDEAVGVEEPTGPDMAEAEERPGWEQKPGATWWSVNSESPYWQTDDGAEEAFELYGEYPAWVKQDEVQEVDWSSWFK